MEEDKKMEIKEKQIKKENVRQGNKTIEQINDADKKKTEEIQNKEIKEDKKADVKEEKPAEEKKKAKKEIPRKEKAILVGKDLGISTKHAMAICKLIKGKNPEQAIKELEQVIKLKKAIPMKGEIPHRKGKIMSGRYPVNASKVFIKLLKTLNGNSSVNGIESPVIKTAKANLASRPFKRGGSMRFKRTNVYLEAVEAGRK